MVAKHFLRRQTKRQFSNALYVICKEDLDKIIVKCFPKGLTQQEVADISWEFWKGQRKSGNLKRFIPSDPSFITKCVQDFDRIYCESKRSQRAEKYSSVASWL